MSGLIAVVEGVSHHLHPGRDHANEHGLACKVFVLIENIIIINSF